MSKWNGSTAAVYLSTLSPRTLRLSSLQLNFSVFFQAKPSSLSLPFKGAQSVGEVASFFYAPQRILGRDCVYIVFPPTVWLGCCVYICNPQEEWLAHLRALSTQELSVHLSLQG